MSIYLVARTCSRKIYRTRLYSSSLAGVTVEVKRAPKGPADGGGESTRKPREVKRQAPRALDLGGIQIPRKYDRYPKPGVTFRGKIPFMEPINSLVEFTNTRITHDLAQKTLERRATEEGTTAGTELKGQTSTEEQSDAIQAALDGAASMQVNQTPTRSLKLERRRTLSDEEKASRAAAKQRRKRTNNEGDNDVKALSAAKSAEVAPEEAEDSLDDEGFAVQTPFRLTCSDPLITAPPTPTLSPLTVLSPQFDPQQDLQVQLDLRRLNYQGHLTKNDWAVVRNQKDAEASMGTVEYASLTLRKNPTLSQKMKERGVNTIKEFMRPKSHSTVDSTIT